VQLSWVHHDHIRAFPDFQATGDGGTIIPSELFRAGINLVHVPYKGGTPAATATVAGETLAMFSGTSSAPQIRAGRLRALAVTGAQRAAIFPELPTIAEFYPGYEVTIWLALFGPPGMPPSLMAQLRREIGKALASPDVKEKLNASGGLDPYATTPEAFAALIRRDYEKYGKLVRDIGVKVD
jgi:tripartite-type tricarboxylate transporter receptor subunit TctC